MPGLHREVFCSTGAFTGRINGRNHRLAIDYADQLDCDGFEIMLFSDWYDFLDTVVSDYRAAGLHCPVIHADKRIGDWMSEQNDDNFSYCLKVWELNCRFGANLNVHKIVCHIWGIPDSDTYMQGIADRIGQLDAIARRYDLDMVAENCFCIHGSPLEHFQSLVHRYPSLGITLDTRPAQFHRELDEFLNSPLFSSGNIRHLHINDYRGGYKDWDAMYPILQPGFGEVDFDTFFRKLKENQYAGTVTLEAPSMRKEGVDTQTLNRSLNWLRGMLI